MPKLENLKNFFPKQNIFYITSDKDDTVLVALDAVFNPSSQDIIWFDTVKDRIKKVSEVKEMKAGYLVFKDSQGAIYTFCKMTVEIFNQKVLPRLYSAKKCQTEKEMEAGLRSSYKNVY